MIRVKWAGPRCITALLAFGLGLAVYGILPLRAATTPPVNWGGASTWPNFLWLVTAEPYRPFLFSLPWKFVPARVLAEVRLLGQAFAGVGLPLGLLGLYHLGRAKRTTATATGLAFIALSAYAIGYNTTDSEIYLLPALLLFALWLGWGLAALSQMWPTTPQAQRLFGVGLFVLPLLPLFLNFSAQNLRQDEEAATYARHTLQSVAPEAVIITDSDARTFALWYARYALKLRPDVSIVNHNLLPYAWYRHTLHHTHPGLTLLDAAGQPLTTLPALVAHNFAKRPLYLATLQPTPPAGYHLTPGEALPLIRGPEKPVAFPGK
jgi:hypothetical protein